MDLVNKRLAGLKYSLNTIEGRGEIVSFKLLGVETYVFDPENTESIQETIPTYLVDRKKDQLENMMTGTNGQLFRMPECMEEGGNGRRRQ